MLTLRAAARCLALARTFTTTDPHTLASGSGRRRKAAQFVCHVCSLPASAGFDFRNINKVNDLLDHAADGGCVFEDTSVIDTAKPKATNRGALRLVRANYTALQRYL
jgi:hypothetical protein